MIKDMLAKLPNTDENVCISLSGGLDSTVLVHLMVMKYGADKVKALSFDFGQRHDIELTMSVRTAKDLNIFHDVIKLDYLKHISKNISALIAGSELKPKTAEENSGEPQVNTYVPFRNLQFASITASFAEANKCNYIFQGLNAVDEYGYWDTTKAFQEAFNNILILNRENKITLIAPFIDMYKDEELILAREISSVVGYDILKNTWSCYNGYLEEHNFKECGKCNTCSEKLLGYIQADYSDMEIMEKFNVTADEIDKLRKQI
ncbi:MAG: 7-cyano-7-deazaguanine synthase QueC [Candidatus Izimaplasma sp.]|nr:7-cyano-7-deazaguanine synthase QueC [Candidatus Izimaplasma bacterium]